jgi:probable HAF family extracellular repeat protein
MGKRFGPGLAVLTLLLAGATRVQAEYIVTDLGTFGGPTSMAFGINDAGQVVGSADVPGGRNQHAFVYGGGRMTDLGTFGAESSYAYGINSSGQIAGAYGTMGLQNVFVYSGGKLTDLGTLGDFVGDTRINDAGQVAATLKDPSTTLHHAYLFSGGKKTDLGATVGWNEAWVQGINSSGQVVGFHSQPGSLGNRAFLYSGGKMIELGTPGGGNSTANGINNAGQVVGAGPTSSDSNGWHAFLYSGGKMIDLGTLGGGGSTANGINEAGKVVGSSAVSKANTFHAFLYSGGKMTDLNSLISPDSHWTLLSATAINNKGLIIGYGYNPNGDMHAFLLTPPAEAPEPSSLALLGLGALGLAGCCWRRHRRPGGPASKVSGGGLGRLRE